MTPAPLRWPRFLVVCALLPLGILGALALSAAATVDLAARQSVPGAVQWAAVAMLEVVSTAGTLLAIFATTKRLRDRAMVAVVASSTVSLVAGLSMFGWFGLVAPGLLVFLVHLAAEAWQELRAEPRFSQESADDAAPVQVTGVQAPANQPGIGPSGWGPPTAVQVTDTRDEQAQLPSPAAVASTAPRARRTSKPAKLAPVPAPERKLSSTQRLRAQAKARGITQKGKKDSVLRAEIAAHDAREQVPA